MSVSDHEMFFFDGGDEAAETPWRDEAPVRVSSRQVLGGAVDELLDVARALDNSDHWPVEALSTDHLDFIQSLDLISQKLREIARIMGTYQEKTTDSFDMELHSGLESLQRRIAGGR